MEITEILEKLCAAAGVSGAEDSACRAAEELLKRYDINAYTDKFGCVRGFIGDKNNGRSTVMLEAHIDEIGFIVTYIDEHGFLKVGNCGGTDRRLYAAQTVTVHGIGGDISGVVCTLPPHVQEDSGKAMKTSDVCIDIGFESREAAEKHVMQGDRVTIDAPLTKLLGTRYTAKAIDNRSGVASVLYALELLNGKALPFNIEILFASQEEVSGMGAKTGSFTSDADIAIAVDTSFAYVSDDKKEDCGEMGKGVMIGISPILDRGLTERFKAVAKEGKIPYQLEVMNGRTGTDADSITVSKGGIPTGLLSIPIKYMHTPVEVVDTGDINAVSRVIADFITGGAAKNV